MLHFAASSQVGESMVNPGKYYYNNVAGTLGLLDAMREAGYVEQLVFSSTAAVYGEPGTGAHHGRYAPASHQRIRPTKLMIEKMMEDYSKAYGLRYVALRYFNAAGASLLGNIGEDHRPETHLIPLIIQAALGQRDSVSIFGTDYPTPDGTCLRDYIHVKDLASAHVLAMNHLKEGGGSRVYNLGTEKRFFRTGNHRNGEKGHRPQFCGERRSQKSRGSGQTDRFFGKNQEGAPLGTPPQQHRRDRGYGLAVA